MTFNPSAPNTIGVEWPVTSEGSTTLDAPTKAHALLIASTAAETISTLLVPHSWAGVSSGCSGKNTSAASCSRMNRSHGVSRFRLSMT